MVAQPFDLPPEEPIPEDWVTSVEVLDRCAGCISYRQLDWWTRRGVVHPSLAAEGSGHQHWWSPRAAAALVVCARVRAAGGSLGIVAALFGAWPGVADEGLFVLVEPDGALSWHLDGESLPWPLNGWLIAARLGT